MGYDQYPIKELSNFTDNDLKPTTGGHIINIAAKSSTEEGAFLIYKQEIMMAIKFKSYRSWLYSSFVAFILSAGQNAIAQNTSAETGPSQNSLQSLYAKRIMEDNAASEQFFGKQGTTRLHGLKKVSCQSVSEKGVMQSCVVMVDITSYGLGRHKVNDQIVVRRNNKGQWVLISDVFN